RRWCAATGTCIRRSGRPWSGPSSRRSCTTCRARGSAGAQVECNPSLQLDFDQDACRRRWLNAAMPYKHILVPTDGSARSKRAIRAAVELAQKFNARLTALYVLGEGVPTLFSGDKLYDSGVIAPKYRAAARKIAADALLVAERAAKAAGVRHTS